jgi:hypothetical protein
LGGSGAEIQDATSDKKFPRNAGAALETETAGATSTEKETQ